MANLKNGLGIEWWLVNILRKRVTALMMIVAFLLVFQLHSALAYTPLDGITITAWTDKSQYAPGEGGRLKISFLNTLPRPVDIYEIYIEYPWFAYNAQMSKWEGNDTITGDPLDTIASKGGHYYVEVDFTVPTDGRTAGFASVEQSAIMIDIDTSEGKADDYPANLLVMSTTLKMAIVDIDRWMTILTASIVISTIILAAVIFLSTRSPRITSVAPRA